MESLSKNNSDQLFEQAEKLELVNPEQAAAIYETVAETHYNINTTVYAQASYKAAVVHQSIGNFKKAVQQFTLAINARYHNIADCQMRLGDIYTFIGDCAPAIDNYFKASIDLKNRGLISAHAEALNKAGECYKIIAEYPNAIEQHKKALEVFESLNDEYSQCITNFCIGNCYNWADELDVAYNFLSISHKLADKLRNPELKIKPLGSLAILFTKNKKFDKAQDYFFEAIDNANLTGNTKVKSDLLKSLGNLYIEIGEYDKAIATLNEGLLITQAIQVKFPANYIHQFLSKAYEKKKQYEKALYHFKMYYSICKEINSDQVNIKTRGLQLKYDIDELQKEKTKAEQNLLLKDKFLASISHELRTPLNGIIGMTDVLSDTLQNNEHKKQVNVVRSSALSLMAVINDLFNYALLNTGQIKKEEHEFDIEELINNIAQALAFDNPLLKQANIQTQISKQNVLFKTDRYLLEKVLKPLILFVYRNSTSENILLKIKADKVTTDYDVILKFAIPLKAKSEFNAENLFGLISESPANGIDQGYEALSLNNASKFADLIDGRISLSGSFPDYEVLFSVLVKTIRKSDDEIKKSVPISVTPSETTAGFKILLVDDNKVNQFLAKTMLAKNGYVVEVASSGSEALSKINNADFGLIITDVHMPGMSGYDLASEIKMLASEIKSTIPVIALTAYDSATEKQKAKEAGISDFLSKPFNINELLSLISKYSLNQKVIKASGSVVQYKDVKENLKETMGGNVQETQKLISMLIDQVPGLLEDIEQVVRKKNYEEAFKIIHKLKSSIKLFKVGRIDELTEILEKNYRTQKNLNDSAKKLLELKERCLNIVKELKL